MPKKKLAIKKEKTRKKEKKKDVFIISPIVSLEWFTNPWLQKYWQIAGKFSFNT